MPVFERMKRLEKLSSFVMDEIKNTHALYL